MQDMKQFQFQDPTPIRVDKAVANQYSEVSRKQVSEWFDEGLISINGRPTKKTQKVCMGDIVSIDISKLRKERYQEADKSLLSDARDWVKFQHTHFLIFEKPANLLVHKTNNPQSVSFIDAVLEAFPEVRGIHDKQSNAGGNTQVRDGLVHRLDKETSGLIVVARTQYGFEKLKQKFADRKVQKEYYAVVRGKVTVLEGEITYPIVRSKVDHTKRVAVVSPKDNQYYAKHRTARSTFRVISYHTIQDQPVTLVSVRIYTGRTHQIRVHMKAIGHVVWGDMLYGGKSEKLRTIPRLALHAYRLGFEFDNEEYVFESAMPQELLDLMSRPAEPFLI
jgi:23S rRNA pseudouridine1911/1915/1917 synthase